MFVSENEMGSVWGCGCGDVCVKQIRDWSPRNRTLMPALMIPSTILRTSQTDRDNPRQTVGGVGKGADGAVLAARRSGSTLAACGPNPNRSQRGRIQAHGVAIRYAAYTSLVMLANL